MDDKRLDELLSDLKKNYDTLPEYTKTENIMNELPKKKLKKPRFRGLPLVAIVAGIFLFSILALPQIGEFQQADEDDVVDKEEVQINDLKEYANEKKEAFRKELGIDTVEYFLETEIINQLLADEEAGLYNEEEVITSIDSVFITPKHVMRELEQTTGQERYNQWIQLIQKFTFLGMSFSQYLDAMIEDLSLDAQEQDELVNNQFNYSGSIEVVELLQVLHKHGYYIERIGNQNSVKHDFGYLVDEVEYSEEDEGIIRFFTYISKETNLQSFDTTMNSAIEMPWYEADDIILEVEAIVRSYPEYHELFSNYTQAIQATSAYLKHFIHAGHSKPTEAVKEKLIEELRQFTENHQDSIFWPLVAEALRKYEAGEFELEHSFEMYNTQFLFNNIESELSYNRLYNFHSWPIVDTTASNLRSYAKDGTMEFLTEVSPLELVSLYTYTSGEYPELHEALYIGESEQSDMSGSSLLNQSSIIIENTIDDNTVKFSFVNTYYEELENTIIATVTLQHDGESWKVLAEEWDSLY